MVHTLYPVCFQSPGLWGQAEKIEEEQQQEVRWLGSLVLTKLRLEGGAERPLGAGQPLTAASWVNLGQGTAEKDKRHRGWMGDKGEKNLGIPTPDQSGAQHPRQSPHLPCSPHVLTSPTRTSLLRSIS